MSRKRLDRDEWPKLSSALSTAEHRVAELVARGHNDGEVADQLSLSQHTVKTHLRNIRGRNGLRNRVQLAVAYVVTHLFHDRPS